MPDRGRETPPDAAAAPGRSTGGFRFGVALLAAAVIGFYFWSLHCVTRLSVRETAGDYYALQVHGWRKGQLAMDVTPHPDLRVEYPNRIVQHAPFLLDASYYQGRYYLYFGPAPALVLLLPYHLLTGWDIPEALAAGIFAAVGFLLSIAWLRLVVRACFPRTGLAAQLTLVAGLGLANIVAAMLVRPLFYELAIASGYAFSQGCLLAVALAVLRPEEALRWLAVASLSAGLAAASRPNLLVGGAVLLPLTVAGLWWRGDRSPRRLIRLLLAAGLPAALCGAGLLAYNYARFDRAFEFGLNLQLGSNPGGFGFTAANLWHNLRLYYFNPPVLDWYFPFVGPGAEPPRPPGYYGIEEMPGQFPLLLAGAAAAVIGLARLAGRSEHDGRVTLLAAGAASAFAANFLLVASSGVRTARYMVDFQPALLLVIALGLLAGLASARRGLRLVARAGLAGLLLAAGFGVFVSFQIGAAFRTRDPAVYAQVEAAANRIAAAAQRLLAAPAGGQRWTVTFPAAPTERREPLLVAGNASAYDALYVEYLGPGRARLLFEHPPHGIFPGPEFAYPPGGTAELELHLGTTYPPVGHPWYGTRPVAEQYRLRQRVLARLDGTTIFDAGAAVYTGSVHSAGIGRRWLATFGAERFSGTIRPRGGVPPPPVDAEPGRLAEAIEVQLPTGMTGQREPLLIYGPPRAEPADSVFIEYTSPDSLRFGYDSAGRVALSPPIGLNYSVPRRLAWAFVASAGGRPGSIRVWLDDREVWSAPLWSRESAEAVALPLANPQLHPSQRVLFTGTILRRLSPPDTALTDSPLPAVRLARGVKTAQTLAAWTRPDGRTAELVVEPVGAAEMRLVWREAATATASAPLPRETAVAPEVDAGPDHVQVRAGDTVRLAVPTDFFRSSGSARWIGQGVDARFQPGPVFGGQFKADRGAAGRADRTGPAEGPIELRLRFPAGRTGESEPLVQIGRSGAGDGVYVRYVDDRHIVLGYDHWGFVRPESAPIPVDYGAEHTVWIDYDSLHADPEQRPGRTVVRLDGREVWAVERSASHPHLEDSLIIGGNPLGMSSSGPQFTGEILSARQAK